MRILLTLCALALMTVGAAAAVPADEAGFTDYMRGLLQARAPERKLTSDKPFSVTFHDGSTTVTVEFRPVYALCRSGSPDCERRIGEFVGLWVEKYGSVARSDTAKLYASVLLQRNFPMLLLEGLTGEPVAARFKGHLWIVCMNDGHPLPLAALRTLDLRLHEAVETCTRNTVAAQVPFDASIPDIQRGQVRRIEAAGAAALVLMHDLWTPVAKRFGGELIVCVVNPNILYYGSGASPDEVRAMEARVTQDTVGAVEASRYDYRFDVLRWTESGWDAAN